MAWPDLPKFGGGMAAADITVLTECEAHGVRSITRSPWTGAAPDRAPGGLWFRAVNMARPPDGISAELSAGGVGFRICRG